MEQGLTIKALSISEDGELVAVGTQNASAILLQRDGTQRFEFMANNVVTGVALLNDGRMLVSSDDRHLYMLSADGKELWKRDFKKMIKNLSATPDGKLAVVTLHNESLVHVLDEQGQMLGEIPIGIAVKSAAVSPNGQWLATGAANQYAYLFNPAGERNSRRRWRATFFMLPLRITERWWSERPAIKRSSIRRRAQAWRIVNQGQSDLRSCHP